MVIPLRRKQKEIIFGLDMLASHRANINLGSKRIEIGNIHIPIIKKSENFYFLTFTGNLVYVDYHL